MITNPKKLFVLTNWEMYIAQYGEYAYLLSNCMLHALRFSIRFAFLVLWERLGNKKPLDNK